jgi:beta-phosphoglucomutase-like phosphatase (HAD superfamily)
VRAFLFDLDGVLVETRDLVIAGWQRIAAERGRSFTATEIVERMFGRRTYDVLVEVFDVSPVEATGMLAAGVADKSAEVAAGPPLREIPGASAFARAAMTAGIPCAVASSASAVNIGLALDAIGLAGAFDVVVDESQVRRGKPAPDPYLAAARALGVDPRDCVVFEDTAPGIAAGIAAGAHCVGIATLGRPDLLERADLVIADFRGQTPLGILHALETAATPARSIEPRPGL